MSNTLQEISEWYHAQCDGDWEHEYGIKIETTANGGWLVRCDLEFTELGHLELPIIEKRKNDDDWSTIKIMNKQFIGSGDFQKLEFLLSELLKFIKLNS